MITNTPHAIAVEWAAAIDDLVAQPWRP